MSLYTPTAFAARRTESRPCFSDYPPADFDTGAHPIIGLHLFGIQPLRPIGAIDADVVANLRRQRQVQALHRLGPRVLDELLAEIGAERGIATLIERKVARYAEIDPKALALTGGDRFPPAPIYEARS